MRPRTRGDTQVSAIIVYSSVSQRGAYTPHNLVDYYAAGEGYRGPSKSLEVGHDPKKKNKRSRNTGLQSPSSWLGIRARCSTLLYPEQEYDNFLRIPAADFVLFRILFKLRPLRCTPAI